MTYFIVLQVVLALYILYRSFDTGLALLNRSHPSNWDGSYSVAESATSRISPNTFDQLKLAYCFFCLGTFPMDLPTFPAPIQIFCYAMVVIVSMGVVFYIFRLLSRTKVWQSFASFIDAEILDEVRYHYEGQFKGCFAVPKPVYLAGDRFRYNDICDLIFYFRDPLRIR